MKTETMTLVATAALTAGLAGPVFAQPVSAQSQGRLQERDVPPAPHQDEPTASDPRRRSADGSDDPSMRFLLVEHGRLQQTMEEARRSLREARAALRQNDGARADAALDQAEQALRVAALTPLGEHVVASWIAQTERALARGDWKSARLSLQQALAAVNGGRAQLMTQPLSEAGASSLSAGAPQSGGGGQPGR